MMPVEAIGDGRHHQRVIRNPLGGITADPGWHEVVGIEREMRTVVLDTPDRQQHDRLTRDRVAKFGPGQVAVQVSFALHSLPFKSDNEQQRPHATSPQTRCPGNLDLAVLVDPESLLGQLVPSGPAQTQNSIMSAFGMAAFMCSEAALRIPVLQACGTQGRPCRSAISAMRWTSVKLPARDTSGCTTST
jgi:hypothetical protein